jgi:hypothetical protein
MQCVTSVFDDQLARLPALQFEVDAPRPISLFGYRHKETGAKVLALWFDGEIPSDDNETAPVSLDVADVSFDRPAYVNLREGAVHRIPEKALSREGSSTSLRDLPVYDSPVLVAELDLLHLA